MKPIRRLGSRTCSAPVARAVQLSFDIEPADRSTPCRQASARSMAASARVTGIDQLLSTHDIVKITGKHRCTIHRWMADGVFPRKALQRGRAIGWLRSDVERWLRASEPVQSDTGRHRQSAVPVLQRTDHAAQRLRRG